MSSVTGGIAGLWMLLRHTEVVLVGVITGTVRINNRMQSICMLSYSTLWAISVPQPIHSARSCRVDYCLNWPQPLSLPLFIFLALTFIEAFHRNSPLAIHFLKWSYREKAHGLCSCVCAWFNKRATTHFHFSLFFIVVSLFFFFTIYVSECSLTLNLFSPFYLFL